MHYNLMAQGMIFTPFVMLTACTVIHSNAHNLTQEAYHCGIPGGLPTHIHQILSLHTRSFIFT